VRASPRTSRANETYFNGRTCFHCLLKIPLLSLTTLSSNGSQLHVFPFWGWTSVESLVLSQIQTISSSKDVVPSSSIVILNGGWLVTAKSPVNVDNFPLPQSMGLLREHVYDNDDELSDFVSPPFPPPPLSWQILHPTTKAPLHMYVCSPIYLMSIPSLGFGLC
jgi:hypothetical protein